MKPDGSDLGATLVQCAKAPVRKASSHLSVSHVAEGLEAVSHDNLLAGLRDGIEQTSKRLGMSARDVEKALPWDDLSPLLFRITSTQRAAVDVWQKHSDAVGGLLTGFEGGSSLIDLRKASAGEYLMNLAGRFVRDKHLAVPIKAFATDLLQWEEIVERCGDVIQNGTLAATYRRRRMVKIIVAASAVLLLCIAIGVTLAVKLTIVASRERLAAGLAVADPCAVEKIAPDDMARAVPEQIAQADAKRAECKKIRERAKYETSCESLATHLEAGKLTADDEEPLKTNTAAVLRRVARGALEVGDFLFAEADMPCQDVPKVNERLWAAYGKAASGSSAAWTEATQVSPKLRKLLAGPGQGLTDASRHELSRRAEAVAKKAIYSGVPDLLAQAKASCDFNRSFGVDPGKNCKGVILMMSRKP